MDPAFTAPPPASLARGYVPPAGVFDELLDPSGAVRPAWQPLVAMLDDLGLTEREVRWETARRLVRRSGVTYNVYDDPRGAHRPWALDPIPFVVSPEEWAGLEAGLVQRARLLDAVLADAYGSQRLLDEGLLAPELLYANPAFLRPCVGVDVPGGRRIHLYAADLGRTPDGRWQVLAERTQVASGAGYALANRLVLASALPEAFGALGVRRLARFFSDMRQGLRALAPQAGDDARIVVLTPGPLNETWFEHAFLARYLGFTLVQGGDLTVRAGGVYLKVLGGLRRVDVILRRLDDDFADPLELRSDSSLGVPGLLHAVRDGTVAVANSLGAGLAEMAALEPSLDAISRRLLGESLTLPGVPAQWCGTPAGRDAVLSRLGELVLKPAFPALGREPIFGRQLDAAAREALAERIRARPHEWVGQEEIALSTTPGVRGGSFEPRRVSLRCYVTATPGGWTVMPGGLTRIAASGEALVLSMQRGAASKDTWVASSDHTDEFTLLAPPAEPVPLTRGGRDLPSRIADDLYWLGRYIERAAGTVRMLRAALTRVARRQSARVVPELPWVLRAIGDVTGAWPGALAGGVDLPFERPDAELLAFTLDPARPAGLRAILSAIVRTGLPARDRLPADAGRVLGGLERALTGRRPQHLRRPGELLERLDVLAVHLAALDGLVGEGITRAEGWRFLDMGRRLERAVCTATLLRSLLSALLPATIEGPALEAMLEIGDGAMTYRRRYLARVQPHAVLDLFLADGTNPRAVLFQLHALRRHVRRLPTDGDGVALSPAAQIVLAMSAAVRQADPLALCAPDDHGRRSALDTLLVQVLDGLYRLSEAVGHIWLSHAQLPHTVEGPRA